MLFNLKGVWGGAGQIFFTECKVRECVGASGR